jgi:hypothetical protein
VQPSCHSFAGIPAQYVGFPCAHTIHCNAVQDMSLCMLTGSVTPISSNITDLLLNLAKYSDEPQYYSKRNHNRPGYRSRHVLRHLYIRGVRGNMSFIMDSMYT